MQEIEIKCLLQTTDKLDNFLNRLSSIRNLTKASREKQLNHYYLPGTLDSTSLSEGFKFLGIGIPEGIGEISRLCGAGGSLRTRYQVNLETIDGEDFEKDSFTYIVCKNGKDASNGVVRNEFEIKLNGNRIDSVDKILMAVGAEVQAKWSRERVTFIDNDISIRDTGPINICIDKNAGYGYLVELEKILKEDATEKDVEQAISQINNFAMLCGLEKLDDARLSRMFKYYNQNWKDYYGTDKVFNIE